MALGDSQKDSAVDETQVAIVAAIAAVAASGIGAGGAILAQMLSVRATDRASAKRFEWEQKQAIRREKAERDALFAEAKRELFAKYLAVHHEYRHELTMASYEDHLTGSKKVSDAFEKFAEEVRRLQPEIALIAPPLAGVTEELLITSGSVGVIVDKKSRKRRSAEKRKLDDGLEEYFESIEKCRKAMAAHLQGELIPES